MAFERFTTSVLNVSALPDRVTGQATTLKAVFDKAGVDIKTALNGLMDQLEALTAAGNIGAEVDSTVAHTVQGILTAFDTAIGNRYTKAETNTLVASNTNDLVKTITFNGDTGVFTITKADNTTVTIDTALEKVPATFELIESSGTYYLRITNLDGSYTQTNVTELMNVYTFSNSSTIAFTKTTNGNTNEISANIRDNSITMDKLALSALTSIQGYVEQAEDSAIAAGNSATNASTSSTASQSWAEGGTNTRTGENTNNAKYYSEQAGSSANNASGSAENANGSASTAASKALLAESWAKGGTNSRSGEDTNNAKYYSEQASSSAEGASGSASTASNKATEAQSWAVGGTGTRPGEDTNNAKYWCEQAEGASAGGDMRKAVYDIDNNGIVDNSEKLEGHSADYFQSLEVAESLLPTDTGTGESVDIINAQPYKVMSVSANGKYQQGDNPSPDNPQPITQVTSMTWNRCGEQLFDKNNFSYISQTYIDQQGKWSKTLDNSRTLKIAVLPNTTYTISANNPNETVFRAGWTDSEYEPTTVNSISLNDWYRYTNTDTPITIPTGNNAKYIVIQLSSANSDTTVQTLQINTGSTAAPYSSYQGQTLPIDLDGNEVCSTDTIKDKVLVDRYGNVVLQKNVEEYIIDTTTSSVTIDDMASNGEFVSTVGGTINGKTITFISSVSSGIIYYQLETPTIIPLPKLSTLLSTIKGINHIWVDTNLGRTDIEIEYVEDLSMAIPDELADLTDDSTHRLTTDAEKTAWNGKANKATYTATIPTTGWSVSAPYTQTISVTGMLATDTNFPVSPVYSSTLATRQAQQEAWGKVSMIEAGADSITVTCDEEVPTETIPIQIMVVR